MQKWKQLTNWKRLYTTKKSYRIQDYLNEFQTLISDANYTNPHTIVFNFKKDLWIIIQNQITTLPVGHFFSQTNR